MDDGGKGHRPTIPPRIASICPLVLNEEWTRCVDDVDEEIFLLYTLAAPPVNRIGLGQFDDKSDVLLIRINLDNPSADPVIDHDRYDEQLDGPKSKGGRMKARNAKLSDSLSVSIRQDMSSLRSVNGDTGSVVWRSSVYLGAKIVQDASASEHALSKRSVDPGRKDFSIFPLTSLRNARILELGAGTGILSSILSAHPAFQATGADLQWLATDQAAILPLLQRNTDQSKRKNGVNVRACVLDWKEGSQCYRTGPQSAKLAFLTNLCDSFEGAKSDLEDGSVADIVIATDCIFNPHLFAPFLDTLTLCTKPKHTLAMVACELRQADMLQDFLQAWIDHAGRWQVRTIEHKDVLGAFLAHGSVVWLAWRE